MSSRELTAIWTNRRTCWVNWGSKRRTLFLQTYSESTASRWHASVLSISLPAMDSFTTAKKLTIACPKPCRRLYRPRHPDTFGWNRNVSRRVQGPRVSSLRRHPQLIAGVRLRCRRISELRPSRCSTQHLHSGERLVPGSPSSLSSRSNAPLPAWRSCPCGKYRCRHSYSR